MTPATKLANAASRLVRARAGEGLDTLEHDLSRALDEFDAQEILKVDIRTRLTDAALFEILEEECQADLARAKPSDKPPRLIAREAAAIAAMRRVAHYADHLRRLIVTLAANVDLADLVYKVRDQEQLGWEGPKVKAAGEAIAGMLAEAALGKPRAPVDNPAEPAEEALVGHA